MNEITIVCCWNNSKQFNVLLNSIYKQQTSVDIVGIDNRKQTYKSCSSAFNDAIKNIKTKYVLFLHQDIIFTKANTLDKIHQYLSTINDHDILGVAGSSFNSPFVKTNVLVGNDDSLEYGGSLRVFGLEECNTLDECMFGGYTCFFRQNNFDEVICNGWHLYTVELCLRNMSQGGKVYVCDIDLVHNSKGVIDSFYNETYRKLCKKYHKQFKFLRTPCCYNSRTDFFSRNVYYFRKKIGLFMRKQGLFK